MDSKFKGGVKIVFIYHVSYGSLLVCCRRVVNKGCLLSPSAWLQFLCLRINCTLCSRLHRALCFGIHRTLCLAFVAPFFAHHPHPLKEGQDRKALNGSKCIWIS